jgi:hypothetical protein
VDIYLTRLIVVWALRYVTVEKGRLAYYLIHIEPSPRYVSSLYGLSVRDDGYKINKRYQHINNRAPTTITTMQNSTSCGGANSDGAFLY